MPNKRLGQNFLINNSISKKIVDLRTSAMCIALKKIALSYETLGM